MLRRLDLRGGPGHLNLTRKPRLRPGQFRRRGKCKAERLCRNPKTAQDAVECYREMITGAEGERADWLRAHLPELRGKNLACFCPLDQPCHADVLLELANKDQK